MDYRRRKKQRILQIGQQAACLFKLGHSIYPFFCVCVYGTISSLLELFPFWFTGVVLLQSSIFFSDRSIVENYQKKSFIIESVRTERETHRKNRKETKDWAHGCLVRLHFKALEYPSAQLNLLHNMHFVSTCPCH